MKNLCYFIILVALLASCNESPKTTKQETIIKADSNTVAPTNLIDTPVVEVIKDTTPTHVFAKGETLWHLARTYYGNRHYSSIMIIYNQIENESNIEPGTLIKIPELAVLLKDTSLHIYPFMATEMDNIMEARQLFMQHEKQLYALRKEQNMIKPLIVPATMEADLQKAATLIDEAYKGLKAKESTAKDKSKMLGQLKSVSGYLKKLSQGEHDGDYGYDIDMVHQRLIHGLKNAIAWSKEMK